MDDSDAALGGFWLTIHFTFARCCGSSLQLPMLPALLVGEIESGQIEPLGWDERNGVLYANAHGRPCSSCLRRLRDELCSALLGIDYYDRAQSLVEGLGDSEEMSTDS